MDRVLVAELLAELGQERTREICDVFLRDAGGRVEALRSALDAGHVEAARRVVHDLTSAAGFVGARRVAELCARIGRAARDGQADQAQRQLAQLPETLEGAAKELLLLVGAAETAGGSDGPAESPS